MYRLLIIFSLFLFTSVNAYDEIYKDKFEQVQLFMAKGQINEAFPLIQELYTIDSTNHYTNYLLGVCYTQGKEISPNSVRHLEYATKNIMSTYRYMTYQDKQAPIFAWFYLAKAYTQNGRCEQAEKAKETFLGSYKIKRIGNFTPDPEKDFFVKNIKAMTNECIEGATAQIALNLKLKSKKEPLYAVKLSDQKMAAGIDKGLTIANTLVNRKGKTVYYIGSFMEKSSALVLHQLMTAKGYKYHKILDVNREQDFVNAQQIPLDNNGLQFDPDTTIIKYAIKVGIFDNGEIIPVGLAKQYLNYKIDHYNMDNSTILTLSDKADNYSEIKKTFGKLSEADQVNFEIVVIKDDQILSKEQSVPYLKN
ncbi:MAG: hypothetical protein MRY83_07145 [Flavobacteriales bacterium]|nr:hypothetical protein [Flavobacteriales bacterium]